MKQKHYRNGYFWGAIAAILGCALLVLIMCAMPADQNGNGNYRISLTVDDKTHTEATFSGEPITAFLSFRDSVPDDIAWHTGLGQKLVLPYGKKDKELQAELFWLSMPTHKDSATGKFYDSVYVSVGGEQYRSNGVRIFVTNLAPVIDSVKISSTTYKIGDTLRYSIKTSDSLPTF